MQGGQLYLAVPFSKASLLAATTYLSPPAGFEPSTSGSVVACSTHKDKTRVQMPAKMFPQFKLLCLLFMGPTLGFDAKQRNSFLIKFGGFFLQ